MILFEFDEETPFFPIKRFKEIHDVQINLPIIQDELIENKVWLRWGSDTYDQSGHCQFLSGNWTVFPIYFGNYSGHGMEVSAGLTLEQREQILDSLPIRFPKTTALLKHFSSINFVALSRLHPHSDLAPHRHNNPLSFICHLGLIIPAEEQCGLKVKDQTFIWKKPGDGIVFNDNLEHSAWNHSNEERIILYIDFRRPLETFKK
ncbi:aspartyl/asparaginyl beta-hydroxylase domain-containing protein [Candidatus Protochlamydia amoebophila]|nr:aspartyl/asparaginyl beta-hydroxylase domain-containing protein [Candidatus Protochlamydia amoebophila]